MGHVGELCLWFGMPIRNRMSVIQAPGNKSSTRRERDEEGIGMNGVGVGMGTSPHTLLSFLCVLVVLHFGLYVRVLALVGYTPCRVMHIQGEQLNHTELGNTDSLYSSEKPQ